MAKLWSLWIGEVKFAKDGLKLLECIFHLTVKLSVETGSKTKQFFSRELV